MPDGSIVQPIYISQQWARSIAKTPLAHLRFHDLRHAHATHLLANGVHPKVASERLGHSKVGITLDLYSHVIPGMQEDAAATVDAALKTALRNRAETKGSNPVAGRIGGTKPEKISLEYQWVGWRPRPELNWCTRFCRPLRNHSATWPHRAHSYTPCPG